MLEKLSVLYLFIITLNHAIKLSVEADIKPNATSVPQSTKTLIRNSVTLDEDTWQPIIQKHTKIAMPTPFAPFQYRATASGQSLDNNKQKHGGNIKKQTHTNYAFKHYPHHIRYGNYSKRPVRTSTATVSSSAFSSDAIKNIKLRTHMPPTNNKINNTSGAEGKNQFIPHHQYQQQQQQLLYSLNNIKTLYPPLQIPKDNTSHVQEYHAKNKKNLIPSQLNSQYLADVTENKKPFPSTTDWPYLQQLQGKAQHVVSLTSKIDTTYSSNSNVKTNTMKTDSEKDMVNVKNSTDTIVTKTLNSFVKNKKSIDNEITNTKKQQLHNHQHYTTVQHTGNKSFTTANSTKKSPTEAITKSNAAERNEVAEKNANVELFLAKTLNNAKVFYDTVKDIIMSDNRSIINDDDYDDDDEEDDNNYKYSNEDKISGGNNDLAILNSSSHQVVKDTPIATTADEAIGAALRKLDLIKNMLLSSAAIAEVQGRKSRNDEGKIKYKTTAASTSSLPSFQKHSSRPKNEADKAAYHLTPSNATQSRHNGQLWNLSTKAKTMSAPSMPKTHAMSSLTAPTSKSFATLSSGRKVKKLKKKLKKKFQKYLLPLLLAYKLKFLTLLPLLIGGLTLLVGTGGMAGFFFALFTAVMSLKSHSRNAIVVKKY